MITASLENSVSSNGGFCCGRSYVIDHQVLCRSMNILLLYFQNSSKDKPNVKFNFAVLSHCSKTVYIIKCLTGKLFNLWILNFSFLCTACYF